MEPLLVNQVAARTATVFPDREIVACAGPDRKHRYTYAEDCRRIRHLAGAMEAFHVDASGWNTPNLENGTDVSLNGDRQTRRAPDVTRVKNNDWQVQANRIEIAASQIR
jgi:hypothetical protein